MPEPEPSRPPPASEKPQRPDPREVDLELRRRVAKRLLIGGSLCVVLPFAVYFVQVSFDPTAVLPVTVSGGLLGGFLFWMYSFVEGNLSRVQLERMAHSLAYLWVRPVAGGGAAVTLYALLVSGLAPLPIFPRFVDQQEVKIQALRAQVTEAERDVSMARKFALLEADRRPVGTAQLRYIDQLQDHVDEKAKELRNAESVVGLKRLHLIAAADGPAYGSLVFWSIVAGFTTVAFVHLIRFGRQGGSENETSGQIDDTQPTERP